MKIPLAILLVALSSSACCASSDPVSATRPFGYAVSEIMQPTQPGIVRGDAPLTVLRLMGAPHRKLAPDVWIYSGFRPHVPPDRENGCDTVVIIFAGNRVSDLAIVNQPAIALSAAHFKTNRALVRVANQSSRAREVAPPPVGAAAFPALPARAEPLPVAEMPLVVPVLRF